MKKISTGCNELVILLDLYVEFIFIVISGLESIGICKQTAHALLRLLWKVAEISWIYKAFTKFSYSA
jgi:hypothetical protein